jgi:ribosomal protein S18 acetylase RimI-like enzyme
VSPAGEPAIVVGGRWQRLGLGTALLERLTERVRARGVTRFSDVVLAENEEAIRLLERLGRDAARGGPGGALRDRSLRW